VAALAFLALLALAPALALCAPPNESVRRAHPRARAAGPRPRPGSRPRCSPPTACRRRCCASGYDELPVLAFALLEVARAQRRARGAGGGSRPAARRALRRRARARPSSCARLPGAGVHLPGALFLLAAACAARRVADPRWHERNCAARLRLHGHALGHRIAHMSRPPGRAC
jgi:hypothetical protein